ncbi:MAG: hypothetical protein ACK499_13690 [Betaproteobacteria bacterium]|jgi:hypothetical protein|nr:hypothetical protein [Betaproteobacteria bacterium]
MRYIKKSSAAMFLASLIFVLMTGCTSVRGTAYSTPFFTYTPATLAAPVNCTNGEYTVTIRLTTAVDAVRECSREGKVAMACFNPYNGGGVIVSAAPKDWNDRIALATIGHEVMHLCGAVHE